MFNRSVSVRGWLALAGVWCLVVAAAVQAAPPGDLPRVAPAAVGMDAARLAEMEPLIEQAIRDGEMAGCVVAVGRRGRLAWLRAYGHRQLRPEPLPMTVDTVFDMASLTKPVVTATAIMQLIERNQLKLGERAANYLPEFRGQGKEAITIEQLLTHQSGLTPDNSLADYQQGPAEALRRIDALGLRAAPGTQFIYSDVGFIVLGRIVERVSGRSLDAYARDEIFQPLGMVETGYRPDESLKARAAATEQRDGQWLRGDVHDPRAWLLGGVAGHAGLFSTAEDLARYAQALCGQGQLESARILNEGTVERMTAAYPVTSRGGERWLRGLGWDKQSGYSSNRGESFSPRAFGHGGFTGTALWVDPQRELFVIFLSNRLHPDGKGSVNRLAGRIGTLAAAATAP